MHCGPCENKINTKRRCLYLRIVVTKKVVGDKALPVGNDLFKVTMKKLEKRSWKLFLCFHC